MLLLSQAQSSVSLALSIAALVFEIVMLVDAGRTREDAFRAAGKMTKTRWLVILGLSAAVGFVFLGNVFSFLSLAAIVAAGVYAADVRPALRRVLGKGGQDGPYGPW